MKKLYISHSSASSLASLAIAARVFSGIIIDSPDLGNSAWLCVILGTLLALSLPLMLTFVYKYSSSAAPIEHLPSGLRICTALLLAAILSFDAAVSAVFIVSSASYAALDTITTFYLLLPLFVLCAWCLSFNGDSIGSSARIWSRLLIGIILIISLILIPDYRPAWLTPLLGQGYPAIFRGAVRIAGWESLICTVFLISEPGTAREFRPRPVRVLLSGAGCAAFLLLVHGMLVPVLTTQESASRFARLDVLLANGRLALTLQLPLLVLWFISLFYQLLFDAFICAVTVQRAFPGLKKSICTAITVAAVAILSLTNLTRRSGNLSAAPLIFPAAGAIVVLCATFVIKKGGLENAQTVSADSD